MSDTQASKTTTYTTSKGTEVTKTTHPDGSIHQRSVSTDGTVTETTQYKDEHGTVHATGSRTNPDGSVDTQTSTRVHNEDGSTTTTSEHTTGGGKTKVEKETVKQEDGSSVTTEVRHEADDSTRTTTTTTAGDGKTSRIEVTDTDANGNETTGSTERVTNEDGSVSTTEQKTHTTSDGTQVTRTTNPDKSFHERSVSPDGTVKEITQHTDKDGTKHSTGTKTNPDGSVDTEKSTRVTNEDGSTTTSSEYTTGGGKTKVEKETVKQEDGSSTSTKTETAADGEKTTVVEHKDKDGETTEKTSTEVHDDGSKSIDRETHHDGGSKREHHTEVDADGDSMGQSTLTKADGTKEVAVTEREVTEDGKVDTIFKTEGDKIIGTRTTTDKDGNEVSKETYDPATGLWINNSKKPTAPNGDEFTGTDLNGMLVDAETGDTFDPSTGDRTYAATSEVFHHKKDADTGEYLNEGTWEGPDGSEGAFTKDSYEGSSPDGEKFKVSWDEDAEGDETFLTLETDNKNEPGSRAATIYDADGGLTTSYENGDTFHRDGFLIDEVAGYDPVAPPVEGGGTPLDPELDKLAADSYDQDETFDELIDGLIEDPGSEADAQQAAEAEAGTNPNPGNQAEGSKADGGGKAGQGSTEPEPSSSEGDQGDSTASTTSSSSEDEEESDSSSDSTSGGENNGDGSEATESTEEEPEDSGGESEHGRDGGGIAGGDDFDPEKLREQQGIELTETDPWDDPSFEALAQPGEGQSGPTPDAPIDINAPDDEIDMPEEINQPDPERDPLNLVSQPAAHEDDAIESIGALEQSQQQYEQVSNPSEMNSIDSFDTAPSLDAEIDVDATFGSGATAPTTEVAASDGQPEAPAIEAEPAPEPATFSDSADLAAPALASPVDAGVALDTAPDLAADTLTSDLALPADAPLLDEPLDDLELGG